MKDRPQNLDIMNDLIMFSSFKLSKARVIITIISWTSLGLHTHLGCDSKMVAKLYIGGATLLTPKTWQRRTWPRRLEGTESSSQPLLSRIHVMSGERGVNLRWKWTNQAMIKISHSCSLATLAPFNSLESFFKILFNWPGSPPED